MSYPLVSIIITAYNYAHTLATAIDSACAQQYPNLEILIMDNASSDTTPEVIAAYHHDARVRSIRNTTNIGHQANHNKGIIASKGSYLCFLSADDMLFPEAILASYCYLQKHPEIDIAYSAMYLMDEKGLILRRLQTTGEPLAAYQGGRNEFASLLGFSNYMSFPSMLVPRPIYETHGLMNENITSTDFDLVLRWAAAGVRFGYLPQAFHAIRIHDGQQSGAKNYLASGQDIRDFLELITHHLTPSRHQLVEGYEHNLKRALLAKLQRCFDNGFHDDGHILTRVHAVTKSVLDIQAHNRQRRCEPRITVIVLPGDSVRDALFSLRSLIEQEYQHWNAIVIEQPQVSHEAIYETLDPLGRIKTVTLIESTTVGRALNQALIIAGGNCFTFMHAGRTMFVVDHLKKLAQAFENPECRVVTSASQLMMYREGQCVAQSRDAYPPHTQTDYVDYASTYPLESIAFKRSVIDEWYYFDEQLEVWPEWDLLARLRRHVAITAIDSRVDIYHILGTESDTLNIDRFVAAAQQVYARHPSDDAVLQNRREAYLRFLSNHSQPTTTNQTPHQSYLQYTQALSGQSFSQIYVPLPKLDRKSNVLCADLQPIASSSRVA